MTIILYGDFGGDCGLVCRPYRNVVWRGAHPNPIRDPHRCRNPIDPTTIPATAGLQITATSVNPDTGVITIHHQEVPLPTVPKPGDQDGGDWTDA